MERLTIENFCEEARFFAVQESNYEENTLFGVTDGKKIGTYFEHKFKVHLDNKYKYEEGNSARGLDFPDLMVDMKVTSIKQPQSSCPFKSARQKIYGLGYSLLIFVYDKFDNHNTETGRLKILHTIFVDKERSADYQTTTGIFNILDNDGNKDDLLAFFEDRRLPVDDIEAKCIADEILIQRPKIGYLTISNALQWRLQYSRVIEKAGTIDGILRFN